MTTVGSVSYSVRRVDLHACHRRRHRRLWPGLARIKMGRVYKNRYIKVYGSKVLNAEVALYFLH